VYCLVSVSCSSSATWKHSDFSLGAQAMTFQLNFLVFNFVNHYTTCRSPTDWDIIYMIRESKLNSNVGAGHIDPCLGCEACWCEARTCYFLRNRTIGSSRTGSPFVPNRQRPLSDVQ